MADNGAGKKVNMIIVFPTFEVCGGVERFLLNFIEVLPRERYQIDLLLFDNIQGDAGMFDTIPKHVNILPFLKQFSNWPGELAEEFKKEFIDLGIAEIVEIRSFIKKRREDKDFNSLTYSLRESEDWKLLKDFCPRYEGYDIAIAFTNTLPLKIIVDKVTAAKKFVFVHNDYKTGVIAGRSPESTRVGTGEYYEKLDGILCLTEQNTEFFHDYYPSLRQKVKVLPNINSRASMLSQASAFYPPEYTTDTFNILTVARITNQKGIDILLKSAGLLRDWGAGFRWFVLGSDHKESFSKKCLELRETLDLIDHVIFLGERSNPFPYYRNCDLYVQPSRFEGRCLSLEEARVLDCAVVATDYLSVHDQIKDGVNGRISPMDAISLARIIYELYSDENERKRLAEGNTGFFGDTGTERYFEYFC